MEFQLKHAVEILKQTPKTLRSLLGGLSDPWILTNEGPETWSPYDVVGHLIHGEETDWIAEPVSRVAPERRRISICLVPILCR